MGAGASTVEAVAGLSIKATRDGRVRFASADGETFMSPAVALRYVALLDGQDDDESRSMAAAMRKAVGSADEAREVSRG